MARGGLGKRGREGRQIRGGHSRNSVMALGVLIRGAQREGATMDLFVASVACVAAASVVVVVAGFGARERVLCGVMSTVFLL